MKLVATAMALLVSVQLVVTEATPIFGVMEEQQAALQTFRKEHIL